MHIYWSPKAVGQVDEVALKKNTNEIFNEVESAGKIHSSGSICGREKGNDLPSKLGKVRESNKKNV